MQKCKNVIFRYNNEAKDIVNTKNLQTKSTEGQKSNHSLSEDFRSNDWNAQIIKCHLKFGCFQSLNYVISKSKWKFCCSSRNSKNHPQTDKWRIVQWTCSSSSSRTTFIPRKEKVRWKRRGVKKVRESNCNTLRILFFFLLNRRKRRKSTYSCRVWVMVMGELYQFSALVSVWILGLNIMGNSWHPENRF